MGAGSTAHCTRQNIETLPRDNFAARFTAPLVLPPFIGDFFEGQPDFAARSALHFGCPGVEQFIQQGNVRIRCTAQHAELAEPGHHLCPMANFTVTAGPTYEVSAQDGAPPCDPL